MSTTVTVWVDLNLFSIRTKKYKKQVQKVQKTYKAYKMRTWVHFAKIYFGKLILAKYTLEKSNLKIEV